VAHCTGLLNLRAIKQLTRVRIPPPPPEFSKVYEQANNVSFGNFGSYFSYYFFAGRK
jgi:hypothetical protein